MRGFVAPLIKLLIFLVITAVATYVLAATIDNSAYGATKSYKANFTEVSGLSIGDDVRIAGVRVGTVEDIAIKRDRHNVSFAQVSFTVSKSRSLPKSVIANMRYRNLVGQRYIDIEQGTGDPNDILKSGGTIGLNHTHPAVDLTLLFQGFAPLVQGLDPREINKLSLEVIQTLQGEGGALEALLANVADLTNALADKDKVIGDVIDNLSSVLSAVGSRDTELNDLIIQLRTFISGLAADRNTIGNAIDGINNLATSTAGLLTQVRAPLAKDIKTITDLVDVLNANSSTITFVLQQLPPTVAGLIRTTSYGSWFNFYLCSLSGILTLPGNTKIPLHNLANGDTARCGS
ncbi:MAG: MCE family protein [Jatrophihabitans sp.]|uniref:MCE family protein n=1 Tax=Jatrophihabitans sp. TaxID=1932789 RepID=UPI00390F8A71